MKSNKAKRSKNNLKKEIVAVMGIVILIISVFCIKNNLYAAHELSDKTICYKPVLVEKGDSLWSIAKENMTEEWGSTKDYVVAIQKFNNIEGSSIAAGTYISIPYYADINESK